MTLSLQFPTTLPDISPGIGSRSPMRMAARKRGSAWVPVRARGVHLTKTMMLAELTAVLNSVPDSNPATVERLTDIHQMTALSLLRVRPSRDFDKNKMSLRLDSGL
jgi:hypothetical protein